MSSSQIIQHIVEDSLVVADLTDRNPNVFYELAIRHAIRKPLVQLIKKGEQIPFDVAGTRTIHIDHHDLDSVEDGKKEVIAQIQALERDSSKIETPISVSLDLQVLRQSGNPEQRGLADVISALSELRAAVGAIEKRFERPDSPMTAAREIELREMRHRYRDMVMETRMIMMEMEKEYEQLEIGGKEPQKAKASRRQMQQRMRHLMDMLAHMGSRMM